MLLIHAYEHQVFGGMSIKHLVKWEFVPYLNLKKDYFLENRHVFTPIRESPASRLEPFFHVLWLHTIGPVQVTLPAPNLHRLPMQRCASSME